MLYIEIGYSRRVATANRINTPMLNSTRYVVFSRFFYISKRTHIDPSLRGWWHWDTVPAEAPLSRSPAHWPAADWFIAQNMFTFHSVSV